MESVGKVRLEGCVGAPSISMDGDALGMGVIGQRLAWEPAFLQL